MLEHIKKKKMLEQIFLFIIKKLADFMYMFKNYILSLAECNFRYVCQYILLCMTSNIISFISFWYLSCDEKYE